MADLKVVSPSDPSLEDLAELRPVNAKSFLTSSYLEEGQALYRQILPRALQNFDFDWHRVTKAEIPPTTTEQFCDRVQAARFVRDLLGIPRHLSLPLDDYKDLCRWLFSLHLTGSLRAADPAKQEQLEQLIARANLALRFGRVSPLAHSA